MSSVRHGFGALLAVVALTAFAQDGLAAGPSQARPAPARACLAEIGPVRSEELVKQCREVSLASRPPCNVQNACALIRDEIRRSCRLLAADAPVLCRSYVDDDEIEDDEEG